MHLVLDLLLVLNLGHLLGLMHIGLAKLDWLAIMLAMHIWLKLLEILLETTNFEILSISHYFICFQFISVILVRL